MSDPIRKKARLRSPAYPSLDLRTAIEKAGVVYDAEKRHSAPVSVVAQHCGYDITSSSGTRAVSALKQFGLLIEEGSNDNRELRVSELALDILISDSDESPQRISAIKVAALSPPLHRKIWEKYGGNLPSKPTLKAFLIREMEFNDAHVDRFIRQLFETVSFARLDEIDTIDDDSQNGGEVQNGSSIFQPSAPLHDELTPSKPFAATGHRSNSNVPALSLQSASAGAPSDRIRLPITLPSLRVAWLEVPIPLNERDFSTLLSTLTMFKDALLTLPSEEEAKIRTARLDFSVKGALENE